MCSKNSISMLPNEMIEFLSGKLIGRDLFHFTLVYGHYLLIDDNCLIRLLNKQSPISLRDQINVLVSMYNSSYVATESDVSLVFCSHKWNDFVYGCFKLEVIEKSLKYFSTSVFSVYCRLWSFNPFYYEASYPTIEIFQCSRMFFLVFVLGILKEKFI